MISYLKPLNELVNKLHKKGFISLLFANYFTQLVAFIVLIYAATILFPEDIGRIKIMQAFVAIMVILAGAGAPTSILKLCGEIRQEREKMYILSRSIRITIVGSLTVYLILTALISLRLISKDPILNYGMWLFGLTIVPLTLSKVIIAFLQATKMFNKLANVQILTGVSSIVFIILLTYFYQFNGFIYGSLISGFVGLILLLRLMRKNTPSGERKVIEKPFKLIWQYGKYPLLSNIVGQTILYFDLFLINYLVSDKEQIGQYGMAITFVGALHLLTATLQQILTPYFAEKSNNIKDVVMLYRKYFRPFMLFSLVIVIVAQLIMPWGLHLFFSNRYDSSIIFFRILSLAWFIKSSFALVGPVFIGIGKTKSTFQGALFSFVFSIGPYFYFVKKYGLVGAAWGTLFLTILTSISINIIYYYTFRRHLISSHMVK